LTAPRSDRRSSTAVVVILLAIVAFAIARGSIHLSEGQLVFFAVLIPSIILHEVSHGWAALLFGDDTAQQAGRLTLNPIAHVDPFGSIILPAILIFTTGAGFGYAKPVPVNPRKMRHPRNDGLLTSLAGPGVNIVLAVLVGLVVRFTMSHVQIYDALYAPRSAPMADVVLVNFGLVNVFLAAFNLIPIPPLDGSAVVERLLPLKWWPSYLRVRQYSMLLVFFLVFSVRGALDHVFNPAIDLWFRLLR
jgi:Zn-dependent protease